MIGCHAEALTEEIVIDNGETGNDAQDDLVPQYTGLGPDVLSGIDFEEFQARLKKFNGEIKGVLTRGGLHLRHRKRLF